MPVGASLGAVSRMDGDCGRDVIEEVEEAGWYDRRGEVGLEFLECEHCFWKCTRRVARRLGVLCLLPTWGTMDSWEDATSASSLGYGKASVTRGKQMGLRLGLRCVGEGLVGETYGRYSVSSIELKRRIEDPLFVMLVGVESFGVPEYDGGAAEYPGGPPDGVEGRAMILVDVSRYLFRRS